MAKEVMGLAKTYGTLEAMSIEQIEWYLYNETDMAKRRWDLYILSKRFKY